MSDTIFCFHAQDVAAQQVGNCAAASLQTNTKLCSPFPLLVGVRPFKIVFLALRLSLFFFQIPLRNDLLGAPPYLPARADPLQLEGQLRNLLGRAPPRRLLHRCSAARHERHFTAAPVGRRHWRARVAARVASDLIQLEIARARPPRRPRTVSDATYRTRGDKARRQRTTRRHRLRQSMGPMQRPQDPHVHPQEALHHQINAF